MKLIQLLCSLLVLLPPIVAAQVPAAYRATLLPFDNEQVFINNAGQAAGLVNGRVALWQPGQALSYMTNSGEEARLLGINDLGQMVGSITGMPTMWQAGRQALQFETGYYGGMALAINNKGSIVLMENGAMDEYGYQHQYFLYRDGQRTPIYGLFPWSVNEQDEVAGNRRGPGGQGAVWRDGVLHDLPDDGYSFARAINEAGWVAGSSGADGGSPSFATIWKDGLPEFQGRGSAHAINDAGLAVGLVVDNFTTTATIFFNGQSHDLNSLWNAEDWPGWVLTSAEQVSNDGMIIAMAQNQGGNWDYVTVLLTPVPEPAPALLMLAGLALAGSWRLRSGRRSA